jgi:hypothetical protein
LLHFAFAPSHLLLPSLLRLFFGCHPSPQAEDLLLLSSCLVFAFVFVLTSPS